MFEDQLRPCVDFQYGSIVPAISPIPLPSDVVDYVYDVFQTANDEVAAQLERMPTTHEEFLDLALVAQLARASGPYVVPSGTIVDLDVHFVGGGRHWGRYEVADIGVIVNFRRGAELLRTKVVLLQSKRLYPKGAAADPTNSGVIKPGGFGSLMNPSVAAASAVRTFRFDRESRYEAMTVDDEQWQAIREFEKTFKIPVHYLLYHPRRLPSEQSIPVRVPARRTRGHARLGARVLSADYLRSRIEPGVTTPAYSDLEVDGSPPGRRLQEFIAEEVLGCREGYVVDGERVDPGLARIFNQRSGPIAAAVRLDILLTQAPADVDVADI
jgi:hypothetical protein